ncbi:hypothetical protein, conserved [Plasmodium gonderi]|uniref:Uncharacterized protein n=1 Tax=Plasmodium gonderi TaxID=77519 RepID=A0A1Y1JJM1_PLAGO|nr:hypothetical protein, conserved [Plasmodium gonderi]GAW82440.1 hypothetical protein, conserved [Plasmodium gonderi]
MEIKNNKRNRIHNEDIKLNNKLRPNNNHKYDNLKKNILYNESNDKKNTDSNSNVLSNTYDNIYDEISSNYEDSVYKSNDDLTEFYLYKEINNHKYNNNLYDFYLSKFNSNLEEKNKFNESNVSFINNYSGVKNNPNCKVQDNGERDENERNQNLNENNREQKDRMREDCQDEGSNNYDCKDELVDLYDKENNKKKTELRKKYSDITFDSSEEIINGRTKSEHVTKKAEKIKRKKVEENDEKENVYNIYFNTLIKKFDYTISCYMFKKTNATHIYRKKILVLKKHFLIINKFKQNINNIYKVMHPDVYDISHSRYGNIYKSSNNIYKFSIYAKRLSKDDASSGSDNSNFFSLKKKKKKKKNNYKISNDGYHFNNEHIRLANQNVNVIIELINLMKIISTYGSIKKYMKILFFKYKKNVFLKNYELHYSSPKYFNVLKKFYKSIYANTYNYIYVNILKIKNIEQMKYNYIYAIIDVDNFLYYYKYEYNRDMFIPLYTDRQNKVIFYFYTDMDLYLGYIILQNYEIEKHIDFDLYKNVELNSTQIKTDFFLTKNNKCRNTSMYSSTSSNKTEKLFSSFCNKTSDEIPNDISLLNQKNIFFDKNYFFVRKLYNDQKKNIQKSSRYEPDSNDDNLYVHIFIYKSKNRFEYLLPSHNTTNALCNDENLSMTYNNFNNNYQLINLFLNNVKRTMQIKNRFNYIFDKINSIFEFKSFLISIISIIYIFFCSYYKNYIHIIILLTVGFMTYINNEKNYDFYKNVLYDFPIFYLFFPHKILCKISKKSNLYHLHTFVHIFILNRFPCFFQYLYKYYKSKCIYFFAYTPTYIGKYCNNNFLSKRSNENSRSRLSLGKLSKMKGSNRKGLDNVCDKSVAKKSTKGKDRQTMMDQLHTRTNVSNTVEHSRICNTNKICDMLSNSDSVNISPNTCKDSLLDTRKINLKKKKIDSNYKEINLTSRNVFDESNHCDNGNGKYEFVSVCCKTEGPYVEDLPYRENEVKNEKNPKMDKNVEVTEEDIYSERIPNCQSIQQIDEPEKNENKNDKILKNLRKYFKNKSSIYGETNNKEVGNNNGSNRYRDWNNTLLEGNSYSKGPQIISNNNEGINEDNNLYNKILKHSKIYHVINNNKQKLMDYYSVVGAGYQKFRSSDDITYFNMNNKKDKLNTCTLKNNPSDINPVLAGHIKKGERQIFSDNEDNKKKKKIYNGNSCIRNTLSHTEGKNHFDKNSSYMYKYNYNHYEKVENYSANLSINEIMLLDLEIKIMNHMKNNYYDSAVKEQIRRVQDDVKNGNNMVHRENCTNKEFCFEINNEKYWFDLSLYENGRYSHFQKLRENLERSNVNLYQYDYFLPANHHTVIQHSIYPMNEQYFVDKNTKTNNRKGTQGLYTNNDSDTRNSISKESVLCSIIEYFPSYFYNKVEIIYINLILIFMYFYCLFIITVHGGLNNDFPLFFYFLNKNKKKGKRGSKHREEKRENSEKNEELNKVEIKKKCEDKTYTSNLLFKSKRIFKNWKQKRKLNKNNIKIDLSKHLSSDASDDLKNENLSDQNKDSLLCKSRKNEEYKVITNKNISGIKQVLTTDLGQDYYRMHLMNCRNSKEFNLMNKRENHLINTLNPNSQQKLKKRNTPLISGSYNDQQQCVQILGSNIEEEIQVKKDNEEGVIRNNFHQFEVKNGFNWENNACSLLRRRHNSVNINKGNTNNNEENNSSIENPQHYYKNHNEWFMPFEKRPFEEMEIVTQEDDPQLMKNKLFVPNKIMKCKPFSMNELKDHCKNKLREYNIISQENYSIYKDQRDLSFEKRENINIVGESKKKAMNMFFGKLKDIKEEKLSQIKNMYKFEKNNNRIKKGFDIIKNKINSETGKDSFRINKTNLWSDIKNRKKKKYSRNSENEIDIYKHTETFDFQNSLPPAFNTDREIYKMDNSLQEKVQSGITKEEICMSNSFYVKNHPNNKHNIEYRNSRIKNNFLHKNFISSTYTYKEGKLEKERNEDFMDLKCNSNFMNYNKYDIEYINSSMNDEETKIFAKNNIHRTSFNSKRKELKNKIISYVRRKTNKKKNESYELTPMMLVEKELLNDQIYVGEENKLVNLINYEEDFCSKINNETDSINQEKEKNISFIKNNDELVSLKENKEKISVTPNLSNKHKNVVNSNTSLSISKRIIKRNQDYLKFYRNGYFSEYDIHRIIRCMEKTKFIHSGKMYKNIKKAKKKKNGKMKNQFNSKNNWLYQPKNDNGIMLDAFNESSFTCIKNETDNMLTIEQMNEVTNGTHNDLFSKKKKIFFSMKKKFLKFKNKNNFFKDKIIKMVNKKIIHFDNECDDKEICFNKNNLIDILDEQEKSASSMFKKNMFFRNTLEINNSNNAHNSAGENSYDNNSLDNNKSGTIKKKERERNDSYFKVIRSKINILNCSNRTYEMINEKKNTTDQQVCPNQIDKKDKTNSHLFNEQENINVNTSSTLKHSRSRDKRLCNNNNSNKGSYVHNNGSHMDLHEMNKYVNQNILRKKKEREKHTITMVINDYNKFLLKKKNYYSCLEKTNIYFKFYYNFLIFVINYFLIFTITYIYMNNIYNLFLCSKHLHFKAKKKERKKHTDFNNIVRIIYHKNVFSTNNNSINMSKHKNMYLKKNIFAQIFVQNKRQDIKASEKQDKNEEDVSSDSEQMKKTNIRNYNFNPSKYHEEIKDKRNILSLYKSAKSNIKLFMSKHMILNLYLEKFLNLFNHKNFNLTKIVISLMGYFSILLLPIKFHHLVIIKLLHMYYKGFSRRYYKNIVLNSILENINNVKINLKLYKPICSLNEEEFCALIEEINKTCNQNLNISQFKDIKDEYDLANIIMTNLNEFSEVKKIIRQEWNVNLLNNSPNDNTNVVNA